MKRTKFILFLFVVITIRLQAQNEDTVVVQEPFTANLNLIGKNYGDSIILRWAPNRPGAWAYGNKTGYVIQRATLGDQESFDPDTYATLNPQPIKPWPLEDWQSIVDQNDELSYAAIAAQALYGESFSGTGAGGFLDQADEFMNRFSFSLLAADFSAETAYALGLKFKDENAEPDKNYIYRVFVSNPSETYAIDTAYFVINTAETDDLPAPEIGNLLEGENAIIISWNKLFHEQYFTAYFIERSLQPNSGYERLNRLPFLNPRADNLDQPADDFQYIDSLKNNYQKYFYRLVGISPFAELSPPSPAIAGMGRDRTPPPSPVSVEAIPVAEGIIEVHWEMTEAPPDLRGFFVGRSNSLKSKFIPLNSEPLSQSQRSFTDSSANFLTGHYYVVAALDTSGNGSKSMVAYSAIEDSIPPAKPQGLAGIIDSTGIVTLTWDLGSEPDLAGYMVLFSNSADHVFVPISNEPLADTVYYDTIAVKTLTEQIYYQIKALDTHYNQSEPSNVLELKRPDLVPPSAPIFSDYEIIEEGISLKWVASSSEDVHQYLLYRKDGDETEKLRISFPANNTTFQFTDRQVEPGNFYQYVMVARDDDGLKSRRSSPVKLRMIDLSKKPPIDDLTLSSDTVNQQLILDWSYEPNGELLRYELLRARNGSNFSVYKALPGDSRRFIDDQVRSGTTYEYSLKAIYSNGRRSPFSNVVMGKLD